MGRFFWQGLTFRADPAHFFIIKGNRQVLFHSVGRLDALPGFDHGEYAHMIFDLSVVTVAVIHDSIVHQPTHSVNIAQRDFKKGIVGKSDNRFVEAVACQLQLGRERRSIPLSSSISSSRRISLIFSWGH